MENAAKAHWTHEEAPSEKLPDASNVNRRSHLINNASKAPGTHEEAS